VFTWPAAWALLQGVGKALLDWRVLAVLAAFCGALWGLHETRRADGLSDRLKSEQILFQQEHASFLAEKAHADRLQGLRDSEHHTAVQSVNDVQARCDARVSAARRSSSAIQALLNKAPTDAKADPSKPGDPELLSSGELWDAIGR